MLHLLFSIKLSFRFLNLSTENSTVLNRTRFVIPNILKTGSGEISAAGVITKIDPHIPSVHVRDISDEDRRFHIFSTSGILKSGMIILAARPNVIITLSGSIFELHVTDYINADMCQFELFQCHIILLLDKRGTGLLTVIPSDVTT